MKIRYSDMAPGAVHTYIGPSFMTLAYSVHNQYGERVYTVFADAVVWC